MNKKINRKRAELVFIPSPAIGHLISTVELAKLLIDRDEKLSITVLIMRLPHDSTVTTYIESLSSPSPSGSIRFVHLPVLNFDSENNIFPLFIEKQKPQVKDAVNKTTLSESGPDSPQLAGFVIDMFCTCMIDVANEFKVPTYVFFTSGAATLGVLFHLQIQHEEHYLDVTELKNSETELVIPCFVNPVPAAKVLPSSLFETRFLSLGKKLREAKGIMINTFMELECHAVGSLFGASTTPKVYPVGPILNHTYGHGYGDIMKWLDDQPPSSVVFLCFGSRGSFGVDQVKEIAYGLEQSGHRFLWSLRQPATVDKYSIPTDYTNFEEVLPQGFLDRTAGIGKVIGWAPQVAVLDHHAIGGFVSHCGWNSTLESLWYGVPIAAWPLYAEQQLNAFQLVVEFGLAVEIKMDYRKDESPIVSAEVIEGGIRQVMECDSNLRKRVKEMKEKSRKALMDGGSSYAWLGCFINDVMDGMQVGPEIPKNSGC